MQNMKNTLALVCFGGLLIVAAAGCKPEYPACDTDKDCKDKEFCVGRKCQQCRNAGDCGEGRQWMLRSARKVRSAKPTVASRAPLIPNARRASCA
jgi:hypothetical protein